MGWTVTPGTLELSGRLVSAKICHCTHTRARAFNGPLSGTTRVSRYQKDKTNLDFPEARDSEWQWHQLGCKSAPLSRQITMPAAHRSVFIGRMPFLPRNQQRQSTEGRLYTHTHVPNSVFGDRTNCRPPDRTAETIDVKKSFFAFFLFWSRFLTFFFNFPNVFLFKKTLAKKCVE